MRKTLLAVLAVLLLAATVQAQPPSFSQSFQVRGAVGDIPTTEAIEPSESWNLEHRLMAHYAPTASEDLRTFHFPIPSGARVLNTTCDCSDYSARASGTAVFITLGPNNEIGTRTLRVTTAQNYTSAIAFTLFAPLEASNDQAVILYVPTGSVVDAPVKLASPGASTDGFSTIYYATFDSTSKRPVDLWFSIHPDNAVAASPPSGLGAMVWIFLALGIGLGALAWYFLVSRGMVQRKGRKQDVNVSAHEEARATESPPVLEGKKRALMAALKEVELARQSNQMSVEVYDSVKADLKKQAVTVMRALETAPKDA